MIGCGFARVAYGQEDWFDPDYRYEHTENDGRGYATIPVNGFPRNFAPIHVAAARGDIETIRGELTQGVPVDLRVFNTGGHPNWRETTPLIWAAIYGQAETVRFLLEAGADKEAASAEGMTALMAAAGAPSNLGGDHLACVKALLDGGADTETADAIGRTALAFACSAGATFYRPLEGRPTSLRRPGIGGAGSVPIREEQVVALARYGDARRVQALLESGADVNVRASQITLLDFAIMQAEAERVRLLLSAGATVDRSLLMRAARLAIGEVFRLLLDTREGREAAGGEFSPLLMTAATSRQDSGQKIEALIAAGADVQSLPDGGKALLQAAARGLNDGSAVVSLLDAGVDPGVRVDNGDTLLMAGAAFSKGAVLEALLGLGFDPNDRSHIRGGPTALMLAAASERDAAEKVRLLLDAGAKIDAETATGETALLYAARAGNMDAVVPLVEARADVNVVEPVRGSASIRGGSEELRSPGMTPLMYVAYRGANPVILSAQTGEEAAAALIRAGAIIVADASGPTALTLALQARHSEVVAILLEAGGLPDDKRAREDLLEIVIGVRDAEALAVMLDHGVDPNTQVFSIAGRLPALAFACVQCDFDTVKTLVEAGADVNAAGSMGMTSLMATMHPLDAANPYVDRALAIIEILLEHGAQVAKRDQGGRTALMHAAASNNLLWGPRVAEIIQRLLAAGADVDDRDESGQTPLHHAAHGVHAEGIHLLLRAGADLGAIDDRGRNALDISREEWGNANVPSRLLFEDLYR